MYMSIDNNKEQPKLRRTKSKIFFVTNVIDP